MFNNNNAWLLKVLPEKKQKFVLIQFCFLSFPVSALYKFFRGHFFFPKPFSVSEFKIEKNFFKYRKLAFLEEKD